MDGDELKRYLYRLGHGNNPDMPTGLRADDVTKITLTSPEMATMVKSFQYSMKQDLDRLTLEIFSRPGLADGQPGPIFQKLLEVPRCGEPDFKTAEMIEEEVSEEATTGRGSWPAGCYKEYQGYHAIAVFIDKSGMSPQVRAIWPAIWDRVAAAYRRKGLVLIEVPTKAAYNTILTFEKLSGSTIGLAIVPNSFSCVLKIWLKLDPTYSPSALFDQTCRLLAHELFHNLGGSHTSGGIMNPSITSGAFLETAWFGDPSEPLLNKWFGGELVPPLKPDVPTEPKPPSGIEVESSITIRAGGHSWDYQLTPKVVV